MGVYQPEKIFAAARKMLPELGEETRAQVEALLGRAGQEEKVDLKILALLTQDETRQRFSELLDREAEHTTSDWHTLGYQGLPGTLPPSPGLVYVCPVKGCPERFEISEEGEKPPRCPTHDKELVPKE